ncbi:14718_t:CDS:1, partial [Racocetra persica]
YPAIVSGYLLNTNSLTTKIVFAISSISLSRLIEHFGDNEPKKINTAISFYLNWNVKMNEKMKKEKNQDLENQEDIIVNYKKDEQDPKEMLINQINRLKSIQKQESKLFEEMIEELQNLQG